MSVHKPYQAKVILVVATDRSRQIGSFDIIEKKLPQLAQQLSMQVYDPGTRLVTGIRLDQICITPIGIHRMVMPTVCDDLDELIRNFRLTKYGSFVVMGCEELYEAVLPHAHRIVHFMVHEDNHHSVFYGGMGDLKDLSLPVFSKVWSLEKTEFHEVTSLGYPSFSQYTYENKGIPHFELKSPNWSISGEPLV